MNRHKLMPKPENHNKGYIFFVTDAEIVEHQNRSVKDIMIWLESTNRFIHAVQRPEERKRSALAKHIDHTI